MNFSVPLCLRGEERGLVVHPIHERPQLARARGMAQFAQRLGFDLAYALAGDGKRLAHFLQRVLAAILQAETHLDHLLLARGQGAQHLRRLLLQVDVDYGIRRRNHGPILDEVAQMRIFLFAYRRLQGDGLLRDLEHLAHLGHGNVHALGDFFRRRLAPQFLHQLPRGADQLVDGLDHVHRNADGAGLVGNGAGNGLPDPPRGVGRELIAAAVLEFVHRLHQTDVAFLNQVEELQTAVGVLLGDGNHQAQVGFDELALGLVGVNVALDDFPLGTLQFLVADAGLAFQLLHVGAQLARLAAVFLLLVVVAGGVRLLFQVVDLALQGAQRIHRLIHPVNQALALDIGDAQVAHGARHAHHFPRQVPAITAVILGPLFAVDGLELFQQLVDFLVVLGHLVNAAHHVLEAVLQDFVGDLFLVEGDDFLDGAHAAAKVVAQGEDFPDHDGRAGKRLKHSVLAALDALGNFHFAFAGEQRNGAHFAQVHAHRVVGFFQRPRSQVELDVLAHLHVVGLVQAGGRHFGGSLENINALRADGGQQVIQVLRRVDIVRNQVVHLTVSEVTLFLAHINQLFDIVKLVFKSQNGLPLWRRPARERTAQLPFEVGYLHCGFSAGRNLRSLAQSPSNNNGGCTTLHPRI